MKTHLSYKLRCYTRISSPEKSRNNAREKIAYFSRVFDIANQLLNVTCLSRLMNERLFSLSANAFYDIYSGIVDPSIFIRTTLLCLYNEQNNTWLLVDMKFLFSCSTRHLTRSLCSLVSYRGKN